MAHARFPALLVASGILIFSITSGSALALAPGDPAPGFDLPWLLGEGTASAPDVFAQSDATVLVIWNRGCPRCTEIALGMDALADSVAPHGGQVVGVLFGPDDPEALTDLLWDKGVAAPHLWDAAATTAAAYELGIRHLGVFVVDRSGTVRALFDDQIANLVDPVLPAAREALARPVTQAQPVASQASALPEVTVDGRMGGLSTEGAHIGDTGLNGELLQNGAVFLFRWDLKMTWRLSRNVDFVPRLIVSNESDEVLTEAEEQRTSRYGTASLNARAGRFSGTLGAYPLRLSPLLLQRWDADDAPPLGGASGCGCGAGGGSGLQQYSLEILGPSYTFEGLNAAWSHRYAKLRGFVAVPRREHLVLVPARFDETQKAAYRRSLVGASIDLGMPGALDPRSDLPAPFGFRGGYLSIDDDQRSIPTQGYVRPVAWDERGWFLLGQAGPWRGITAEAEYVDWHVDRASLKQPSRDGAAYRAGVRVEEPIGRTVLWGALHRLRCDRDFSPVYAALTYEPNREGWRGWAGIRRLVSENGSRERWGLALFYRGVQEVEAITWAEGSVRERVASISLSARPLDDLLVEAHGILNETDRPGEVPDLKTRGLSTDLRWDARASIEPTFRLDVLRRDDGESDPHTIWEGWIMVRVLK